MNINHMFPKKYASGSDLNGKEITLVIRAIKYEKMFMVGNRPEDKPVIYFEKATKGIILSAALGRSIAQALQNEETDDWTGKAIKLYPVPMKVAGEDRIAIRAKAISQTTFTPTPPAELQDEPEE
jgi:hypothetical protein